MPTDAATTEAEAFLIAKDRVLDQLPTDPHKRKAELIRRLKAELLAAEQRGYRRGVADAAKVCRDHQECDACADEIRRRLGGAA